MMTVGLGIAAACIAHRHLAPKTQCQLGVATMWPNGEPPVLIQPDVPTDLKSCGSTHVVVPEGGDDTSHACGSLQSARSKRIVVPEGDDDTCHACISPQSARSSTGNRGGDLDRQAFHSRAEAELNWRDFVYLREPAVTHSCVEPSRQRCGDQEDWEPWVGPAQSMGFHLEQAARGYAELVASVATEALVGQAGCGEGMYISPHAVAPSLVQESWKRTTDQFGEQTPQAVIECNFGETPVCSLNPQSLGLQMAAEAAAAGCRDSSRSGSPRSSRAGCRDTFRSGSPRSSRGGDRVIRNGNASEVPEVLDESFQNWPSLHELAKSQVPDGLVTHL